MNTTDINSPQPQPPAKRLVGVVEFSRMVDLSRFTVYRLIKERKIPFMKLGNYKSPKARILLNPDAAIAALEKLTYPVRKTY